MNTSNIKTSIHDFAGWEDLGSASVQEGTIELPRILADQFESELSDWRDEVSRKIQNSATPKDGRHFLSHNTKNAVNALNHLIDMQGMEISNRNNNCAFATSFIVRGHLEAAFEQASEA